MNYIPTQINQPKIIKNDFSTLPSKKEIEIISLASYQSNKLKIPIYSSKVEAGFTSPADDFIEEYLDLNDLLVKQPEATFFVRVSGKSMVDAGIFPGDILIVDRSLTAKDGKIIIANVDGDVTVKRLSMRDGKITLKSESSNHKDITITGELHIWGVVTSVIHRV